MLAKATYDSKKATSYVKRQLKLIKKNKDTVNSEDIFNSIITDLSTSHNIIYSSNIECIIKLDKKVSNDNIKEAILSTIDKYYEGLDTNMLFKIFVVENEVIIKRKRQI